MGIFSSKTLENMLEESGATGAKASSPEHVKKLSLDPRSPSDEIARTPILVEQTPNSDKFRELSLEESFDCASLRTPLGAANSKGAKKGSLSQRILSKFSQQQQSRELPEVQRHDENDVPVQLLKFELSAGESTDSGMDSSTHTGKVHRI